MPIPKPEYPRPDFDRSERWLTLNGEWRFETADAEETTIIVPFAWETASSTVGRTWLERAVYRRDVIVPADWDGSRIILTFGAVHHAARVLVGGVEAATHIGGYTSFEVDITDLVAPGEFTELVVEVDAPADKREIPHGKQRSIPRDDYDGVSFTPTSGIWQSVWLEARGRTYLASAAIRGDSLAAFEVDGTVVGDDTDGAVVTAVIDGRRFAFTTEADGRFSGSIPVDDPQLWSPGSPHLYSIEFSVGRGAAVDRVVATAGLRRIEIRGEEIFLNGGRVSLRGVLDQGYWDGSGLTAPDDRALLRDLDLARGLGFNLVRKHLKFEEPRWLDYADRIGMLVWAEPACASRYTPASAAAFEAQLPELVRRDGNHPSIVVWGLYNEEWGLDWDIPGSPERAAAAVHAYETMRALDDSRPIVENSGWSHVRSDLIDWHYYDEDPRAWAENLAGLASGRLEAFSVKLGPDFVVDKSFYGADDVPRQGIPILNSEFGAGFTSLERAWHVRWQTQEIRRHDRFAGYVYTELTDVEHEMAGLLDSARRVKDWGGLVPSLINAETILVVDVIPAHAGADIPVPEAPLAIDVHVSHHGETGLRGTIRAAWSASGSPQRTDAPSAAGLDVEAEGAVEVEPFRLSESVGLMVSAPSGPARLHLWFETEDGRVFASTFVDAAVIERPNRRGARQG